jgi:hypothetical protein
MRSETVAGNGRGMVVSLVLTSHSLVVEIVPGYRQGCFEDAQSS